MLHRNWHVLINENKWKITELKWEFQIPTFDFFYFPSETAFNRITTKNIWGQSKFCYEIMFGAAILIESIRIDGAIAVKHLIAVDAVVHEFFVMLVHIFKTRGW